MLKRILVCVCVFSALSMQMAFGAYHERQCQPSMDGLSRLKHCLMQIQKLPDARKLMAAIEQEGPIHIVTDERPLSQQFGAFWDTERRVICINLTPERSDGEVIGSVLFEMHNALVDSKFKKLDELAASGRIDRESYVREMERLEFQNSHGAAAMAQRGINMGLFPVSARLSTYPTFEEHYRMQKIGGHSQWIAKNYDQVARRVR